MLNILNSNLFNFKNWKGTAFQNSKDSFVNVNSTDMKHASVIC